LGEISKNPMGIGWGAFAERLPVYVPAWERPDASTPYYTHYLRFPHNTVLEVFVEGGWLVGVSFLGLLLAALFRAYLVASRSRTGEARALFALLAFFAVNAMVSGELNDRVLFAFLGLGLAFRIPPVRRRDRSTEYETASCATV
jgi:O-antigen ligase